MIPFLVLLAVLAVIVIGIEALARSFRLPLELTRKSTHILVGVTVALAAFVVPHIYIQITAVLFMIVISVSRSRGIFQSIHDADRGGVGELWYPTGILLATVFFPEPRVFAYAILILAVSDGLAGLIGKYFGRRRIPFIVTPKTYLGSTAFFASAFGLSLGVVPAPVAVVGALFLTLLELLSPRGLDNLVLPLAAGVITVVYG